jgi:hypothetical protein
MLQNFRGKDKEIAAEISKKYIKKCCDVLPI